MRFQGFLLIILISSIYGCSATSGTTLYAPDYKQRTDSMATVAVMPLKLNLFQIQAGGNVELIDEWRDEAQSLMQGAIKDNLDQLGMRPVFAEKDYLRQYHLSLWRKYRALYESVTAAALLHGFDLTALPSKQENFDYTVGPGIQELARLFDADALLFVYGTDNTNTAGRNWVAAANLGLVNYGYDSLIMALVDGKTGDFLWLKRSAPYTNMNLRDAQFVEKTTEWMFADFNMSQ